MGSCLSIDGQSSSRYVSASSSLPLGFTNGSNLPKEKFHRGNASFECTMEMSLHRVRERFFLNGATSSSSFYTKQGQKGTNQDAMVVWEKFGPEEDATFCGVFDGHGPNGHLVAKKVRDSLPLKLGFQWENDNAESGTFFELKKSLLDAFKNIDEELRVRSPVDFFSSGTTAVTLVKQGDEFMIGNLGDSRAVLGTTSETGALVAIQLTVDLKPNLPREADRIRHCKGRVFSLPSEREVARIWLPYTDAPGLAMARAFGDFCLKDFGLISTPEISHRRIIPEDKFIILATDGIWDVISNEEAVEIVATTPQPDAAKSLVEIAIRAWRVKYPKSKVDDCSCICLFLDSSHSSSSSCSPATDSETTD